MTSLRQSSPGREFALASAAEKGYQMTALKPVPALVGL